MSSVSPSTARADYRPDIDGLRAIAVSAVLLFHCGLATFSGGFVGVDVFFVISGYLITGHLVKDIGAGRLSLRRFYLARLRRIAPALLATMIVTWVLTLVLMLPPHLLRASQALVAAVLSGSNIFFWKTESYFGLMAISQPLLHTWSLSVEGQFYALMPLVMLLAVRLRVSRWALLFGVISVISFAISVYLTDRARSANFYLLPPRIWEFGVGALAATLPLAGPRRRWLAELAAAVGLVLIVAPVFLFDSATSFPGINALYPCLGTALVIRAGRTRLPAVSAILTTRPMVGLGLISYSLFLVHWPVIVFLHFWTMAALAPVQIAAGIAISLVLAVLSWRFVETPFRRGISPWRLLTGIAVAGLAGCIGVVGGGFPARYPNFQETAAPDEAWKPGVCFLDDANALNWSPTACTRVATGPQRVLLWGDSFAAQYTPGLVANADALKATVIQYTAAGCVPLLETDTVTHSACQAFNLNVLNIIREQHISMVLLSARWTEIPPAGLVKVRDTLNALTAMGVRVIMLGESPEFAEDVHVIAQFKGDPGPGAVNHWPVYFDDAFNTRLAQIASPVRFIDPMARLCTQGDCTYEDRGTFLYADFGHMSPEGSRRAVAALLNERDFAEP